MAERAESYSQAFPRYPKMIFDKGWLLGIWSIGNNYKAKQGYPGEFPPSFLDRVYALFPDKTKVFHLFSGKVETGRWPSEVRLDQNPELDGEFKPEFHVNIEDEGVVSRVREEAGPFDLIVADPPYTEQDSQEKYRVPLVSRNKVVLDVCPGLLAPGGHLVWLDLIKPMFRKKDLSIVGEVGLTGSTNHRIRGVWIWEKQWAT